MGFLNNSGDIILDAVLTDTGRARLSKGDGSFKITKFALADDEINYKLFVANTGSAYQDLQILQTPVLESFTNNFSSMKNKLLTVNLKDLLYMPVMKVNDNDSVGTVFANAIVKDGYIISVDANTTSLMSSTRLNGRQVITTGVLAGNLPSTSKNIRVDQGIDNKDVTILPEELKETQYIIEIDNRLGSMVDGTGARLNPSYIDDDDVASYFVSLQSDTTVVANNPVSSTDALNDTQAQVIAGPRGTYLSFKIESSILTQTSDNIFQTIGTKYPYSVTQGGTTPYTAESLYVINSNIIVTGATTGYSISIPVAFVKFI